MKVIVKDRAPKMPMVVPCMAGHGRRAGRMSLKLLNNGKEEWYQCENPNCTYHWKWLRGVEYYRFHRDPDKKTRHDGTDRKHFDTSL